MRAEAELGLLYPQRIQDDYDVEVAYLECGPTKIMAGSTNQKALKLAWVHCDLAKKSADPEAFVRKTAKHYRKFDHILCVSEDVKDSFIRMYGQGYPVQTIYNCYDDQEIRAKASGELPVERPAGMPVCLAIGRLSEQKSFERLLHVHHRLMQEGSKYQLWILGEGVKRPVLEEYIREHHLEDSAHLLGFQSNPYPFINAADFLVCSSLYEGFSTVAVEGLILGKTMVTTCCTGMEEIFGDSEYGLITENSEEGLYLGMKRMLTEPGLREELSAKAAVRGRDFSRKCGAAKTEQFIVEAMEAKMGKR